MPTLVVQCGHVGRTSGNTGAPGEREFTARVGEACARLLGRRGWSIRVVPADPVRAAYRGDAFVAVHADGNNNPDVDGASVGYQTTEGRQLAEAWRSAYQLLGWSGPWHRDNYTTNLSGYYGVSYAVGQGNRRACIVECGTITNPAERAAMTSQDGVDRVALAIGMALGILLYQDVPWIDQGRSEDMIITCAAPNRCGILSGGMLLDITDDTTARGFAQSAINRSVVAEIRVSEATWNRLATASRIDPSPTRQVGSEV